MEKKQRNFDIKIVFEDFGLESVQSIPDLTEEQINSLDTIPPYYYNLTLSGHIDSDKFVVESAMTNNHGKIIPITHKELGELFYESDQIKLSWIVNQI